MKTLLLNILVLTTLLLATGSSAFAQMGISSDGSSPDNSAMLEIKSTSKGMLIPRMTQNQISFIISPANGLQVYCTSDNKMYIFTGTQWKEVAYGSGAIMQFVCGISIVVDHVAGTIAPVNKTVTYGTVTNILGATSKCWIASNLGADHQATAKDDATEASAGWYWQFNRKQGYKLADDGTTRTPNTTWISSIDENLDWQADNDPCALEIGSSWRIPTATEWTNVNAGGNWTDWNDPWNSSLKLHAAGYLYNVNGALNSRCCWGYYWSNTQGISTNSGWALYFNYYGSNTYNYANKALAFSIRCLRD